MNLTNNTPRDFLSHLSNLKTVPRELNGMPTKEELMESLKTMVGKVELPANQKRFAKYNKTLQLDFTDIPEAVCYIVFQEGSATINEGVNESAELRITTTSETMMAVLNGTLSPTRAFMSGQLKAKGPPNDLMKLQALMK